MSLSNISSSALVRSGVLADTVNDAESTRKVYLLAGGLALLGVVLIAITVWFWRNTRHDPELLGPLEVMSARRFRKLDDRAKQQLLDAHRPPDAQPMRWGVGHGDVKPVEEVDLRVAKSSVATGYDDLRDDPPPVDSTSETGCDEFAIVDDNAPPAAAQPVTLDDVAPKHPTPPAIPLVIVPMDHDLPTASTRPSNQPVPSEQPIADVVPDEAPQEPRPSIDPLLRTSDRSDS
jgi:hypothetical protein